MRGKQYKSKGAKLDTGVGSCVSTLWLCTGRLWYTPENENLVTNVGNISMVYLDSSQWAWTSTQEQPQGERLSKQTVQRWPKPTHSQRVAPTATVVLVMRLFSASGYQEQNKPHHLQKENHRRLTSFPYTNKSSSTPASQSRVWWSE